MSRTTFDGKVRSYNEAKRGDASPGVVVCSVQISGDPAATAGTDAARCRIGSSATTGELAILPKGAFPLRIINLAGVTGTSPAVNIGLTISGVNDADGLRANLDADGNPGVGLDCQGAQVTNALKGVGIASDSQITCSVGSGSGHAGTWSGILMYAVYDDGTEASR